MIPDGIAFLLDQAGVSLAQAQQIIAEQAKTIQAQAQEIAALTATAAAPAPATA